MNAITEQRSDLREREELYRGIIDPSRADELDEFLSEFTISKRGGWEKNRIKTAPDTVDS